MWFFIYSNIKAKSCVDSLKKQTKSANKPWSPISVEGQTNMIYLNMDYNDIELFSGNKALCFLNYPLVFKGEISETGNNVCIKGKFCYNNYFRFYIIASLLFLYVHIIKEIIVTRQFFDWFFIAVLFSSLFLGCVALYLLLFKKETKKIIKLLSDLTQGDGSRPLKK